MNRLSIKQLTIIPVIVVLVLLVFINYLMNKQLEDFAKSAHQHHLQTLLENASLFLSSDKYIPIQSIANKINHLHQITEQRYTLVDFSGKVLADSSVSQQDVATLENHSSRPEIKQALASQDGVGVAWRYSNTLKTNLLYSAKLITIDSQKYYLRIAMPQEMMFNSIKVYQTLFFVSAVVSVIIVLLVSWLIVQHINRRIKNDHYILEQRIKERTHEISSLNEISALLSSCNSFDELYSVLSQSCQNLFPEASGALAIYNSSREKLKTEATWGDSDNLHNFMFEPDECWGLKRGTSHIKHHNSIACSHNSSQAQFTNQLCIPLTARGETLGVLQFYSNQENYLDYHQVAVSTLSENLSLALAGLFLREELRNQALHDPLTGLFNRRYLEEAMLTEIKRSNRHGSPVALMMIDADHFKRYNDVHGHDAGDFVLQVLARCLNETVRSEDIICRYGGEEFVVLLPQATDIEAKEIAERMQQAIANSTLQFKDKLLPSFTLSIGVVMYPHDSEDAKKLIELADSAMYFAKNNGRNQVVCYADIRDKIQQQSLTEHIPVNG
ncbi:diguanylate cyclase [Shewanella gaetbuli]|uniref:diguanylate cyclase n=1 Tax=Shewanella gaetbuli TaxID=220752 RepID=A0A9X1ZJQ8_9GAMM|nr:diguanylate cyclase [Shewanella gaetbuli]MCL1143559.1 GGDEF domain-containing protein [Shewanella gaetbuli]